MSFERSSLLESQPTTMRRGDDPAYTDDPEFQRFTSEISEKLFTLTRNINQLAGQVQLLGTKRETERVRERVQDLVEETGNGFKEVGEGLKRVTTWPDLGPSQKFTQGKLNQEFRASLTQFQVLQRQALERQRASQAALEADAAQNSSSPSQQGSQSLLQQQEQARLAPQSDVDFQSNLIIEREAEIRQIEQSVGELNELFRDVATMVHAQGEQLDIISHNVEGVREDTRGADTELRTANRYQKNARNKACCLLLILAVVLLVIILAVVVG